MTFGCSKKILEGISKIRLLVDLCNLVVSNCAKSEGCAAKKTVGGAGFLRETGFSKKHYWQISPHGCQFDFKLGEHDKKWSKMLHYKFYKVGRSILNGRFFQCKKFDNFGI